MSPPQTSKKEATVSEMVPLNGTPWERLIMKDGHPLTPEEQRREKRKFERAQKQRESESPAEREARIRKYEDERAFIREIPDAYNFTPCGAKKRGRAPGLENRHRAAAGFRGHHTARLHAEAFRRHALDR